MKRTYTLAIGLLAALASAGPALCENAVRPGEHGNKFGAVFMDAGPIGKLLTVGLVVLTVVAVIGAIRRWPPGARLSKRLVYGGVLVGLGAVVFEATLLMVRFVYDGGVPPFVVWAPALAEMLMILTAGFVASIAGIFTRRLAD